MTLEWPFSFFSLYWISLDKSRKDKGNVDNYIRKVPAYAETLSTVSYFIISAPGKTEAPFCLPSDKHLFSQQNR